MNERKLLKKSDLLVLLVIAAVAAVCFFAVRVPAVSGKTVCRVLYDGRPVKTVSLDTNGAFKIAEAPLMEFEVRDGKIAATHSDCPDKVCVRTGFIGHAGQKIVCLPNRVTVSIDSAETGNTNHDEPDMIAQ